MHWLVWLGLTLNAAVAATPVDLRCEYRVDPLGLDTAAPRFSWRLESPERGYRQSAWQLRVVAQDKTATTVWDSGRVSGAATTQVVYAGQPLTPLGRYRWRVRSWDAAGRVSPWSRAATFSMGPDRWPGAWIGVDEPETPVVKGAKLAIVKADWGVLDKPKLCRDATAQVAAAVVDNTLDLEVGVGPLGGDDPAYGQRKQLRLVYTLDGERHEQVFDETTRAVLPPGSEAAAARLAKPRYLRRGFTVSEPVRRATVYATALGLYELRLNGRRVGDQLLAPEWTNYRKRVQYQTFDVTRLMRRGDNALGAVLGNGWYCGAWQFWEKKLRTIYGTQPYLRLQLQLELADGRREVVTTDDAWRGTTAGPLQFAGLYEGETYDARAELTGWDKPGFNDAAWRPASVAHPEVGRLVWQRDEPIRVTQELKPVAITEPAPGIYVFDFGQNFAGWCRLKVKEAAGTQLTLKFNEVLAADGTVYMDNLHAGHLSTGDRQIDRFTCSGRTDVWEPRFTYHGFRYVEVHGLTQRPSKDMLTGRAFNTDFARTGEFACSEPLINRLVQNIQWSQRANMMGVPTDCCQRDERCGYTGDAEFFMPTAVYNFDVAAFFNKWLVDVCEDAQMPGGWFTDHAPHYGPGPGPDLAWSDAGISCPYAIYRTYGDTRVVSEHYAAMARHMEWLKKNAHGDLFGPDNVGLSDWLNLGGGADLQVIGTAYWARECAMMAEMAAAIGKGNDATVYRAQAEAVGKAFGEQLVDADGRVKNSSQTGYALAFEFGLVPSDRRAIMTQRFADELARFKDHLATGFIGTPRLLPALHAAGRDDLAYRVLLQRDFPSWLYPVTLGATTVWERWDGWRPDKGFQDSGMNSFNHYSFGAVGEYLYRVVGGISAATPGYGEVRIAPQPGPGLDWAQASYVSAHGLVRSRWERRDGRLVLDVELPANTTGLVVLPTPRADQATEGGVAATQSRGVELVAQDNGSATFRVGSGRYHFVALTE